MLDLFGVLLFGSASTALIPTLSLDDCVGASVVYEEVQGI